MSETVLFDIFECLVAIQLSSSTRKPHSLFHISLCIDAAFVLLIGLSLSLSLSLTRAVSCLLLSSKIKSMRTPVQLRGKASVL